MAEKKTMVKGKEARNEKDKKKMQANYFKSIYKDKGKC